MAGSQKVQKPPQGKLYHGVYPGKKDGDPDDIAPSDLKDYVDAVHKKVAWVYFASEWSHNPGFPTDKANWIWENSSVPFIRLMLRSQLADADKDYIETKYTLDNILAKDFDSQLKDWASEARSFAKPLLVEYGTECNGKWSPWNAKHAGKDPKNFVRAYQHIVSLMRDEMKADNISWVFHVNSEDQPDEAWNRLEDYYPSDHFVDCVGVSVYGPQQPQPAWPPQWFDPQLESVYPRLRKAAPTKPVIVAEFGCAAGFAKMDALTWSSEALKDILSRGGGRYDQLIGFSWWNDAWTKDTLSSHDTEMRVQAIQGMPDAFRNALDSDMVRTRQYYANMKRNQTSQKHMRNQNV